MRLYSLTNPYQHGDPPGDLEPLQKALQHAGLYKGQLDDVFGPATADACYRAKYRLGYPLWAVNHTGGQTLLNYLRGTAELPFTYVVRRRARGFGLSAGQRMRLKLTALMEWSVNNQASIHYRQARPMDELGTPQKLPWYTDCSEYVTTLFKWAGLGTDPNGMGWSGYGNTDTLLNHGSVLPTVQALPGDVVVWPPWQPSHHTAFIYQMDIPQDPLICSMGNEAGPVIERLSAETQAQQRPYVIRRYITS